MKPEGSGLCCPQALGSDHWLWIWTTGYLAGRQAGRAPVGTLPAPHPVRDPVSNLAVNLVWSGDLRGRLCGVSHTPHVRDFIPLSQGKEK